MRYAIAAVLLLGAGPAWPQPAELRDAVTVDLTSISDLAAAARTADGAWLAFSMPVQAGTRSPCCWKGRWDGPSEVGCMLGKSHESSGTRSDAPLTGEIIVFSEIADGRARSLRIAGEGCPVAAGGARVHWLGDLSDGVGLDWLEGVARSDTNRSAASAALYAMALHRDPGVDDRLHELAKSRQSVAEDALFWLGEKRGEGGLAALKGLLKELPIGDLRRHINFVLALNDVPAATDLLVGIARGDSDPRQRSDAMFWLAQEHPKHAMPLLLEVIENESSSKVLDEAVFAIAQLADGSGDEILLGLARDSSRPRAVRKQALFWLTQSDSEETISALIQALQGG